VDTAELKRAWTFDTGAKILASPSVAGDSVLVGNALGTVHALDALTGDKLWKFDTDGRITSTPVTAHGTVYVTSWDGSLYAIE
jgi:outer membrane protein assembly factor BamB